MYLVLLKLQQVGNAKFQPLQVKGFGNVIISAETKMLLVGKQSLLCKYDLCRT